MSAQAANDLFAGNVDERVAAVRVLLANRRVLVSVVMLLLAVVFAVLGPVLSPYGPAQLGAGDPLLGPTLEHPFGTDQFGRDQLARLADGGRISLAVAAIVAGISVLVGTALGLVIGYLGGVADFIAGRFLDFMFAFPTVLLALALATILEPSLRTAVVALTIIFSFVSARFVRGLALSERSREYVLSARVSGASVPRILVRHILPNIVSPLLVLATTIMAFSILGEAALSYLGVGSQPPTASWGKMLTDGQAYMITSPLLVVVPGLAISYLVLAVNMLGDGLRDHLDPRFREQV